MALQSRDQTQNPCCVLRQSMNVRREIPRPFCIITDLLYTKTSHLLEAISFWTVWPHVTVKWPLNTISFRTVWPHVIVDWPRTQSISDNLTSCHSELTSKHNQFQGSLTSCHSGLTSMHNQFQGILISCHMDWLDLYTIGFMADWPHVSVDWPLNNQLQGNLTSSQWADLWYTQTILGWTDLYTQTASGGTDQYINISVNWSIYTNKIRVHWPIYRSISVNWPASTNKISVKWPTYTNKISK